MIKYQLLVYGDPKAQPRPRAFARKMGNKYVARVYDADTADAWKQSVVAKCRELSSAPDHHYPRSLVKVEIAFYFPRPKSHLLSDGKLKLKAPSAHTQKPDLDNLAKAVLDAITESQRFWVDDSQIVSLRLTKQWTTGRPGCAIEIQML